MGDFLDWVLNPIHRFLMRPGWEDDCPSGYHPYRSADGASWCIADFPTQNSLLQQQNSTDPAKEFWKKPSRLAEDVTIAHGKTCPPGTFGSNGLCYTTCPDGYTLYKEVINGGTYLSCRSKCENGWAPLDWKPENDNVYGKLPVPEMYQNTPNAPDLCWHELPLQARGNPNLPASSIEKMVDMPYNLAYQETRFTDQLVTLVPSKPDEDKYGPQPVRNGVNPQLEKAGVYAARIAFSIGPAVPPAPCYADNLLTDTGKCVKPCPRGYELIGDECWYTSYACPADISTPSADGSACNPDRVRRKGGPSIIAIVAMLGVFAIVGGLVIKLVTSRVFSSSS